jgi:hypothetical protein
MAFHMPTELPKHRERKEERYGYWQDGLMLIGLVVLSVLIAKWLWGG